jgi:CRP-like cAMP-binding protein
LEEAIPLRDVDWTDPRRLIASPPTHCVSCPLRALDHFKNATKGAVAEIERARLGVRRLPPDTTVYVEGDPPSLVFTLFDGWVLRSKLLENGKRQILNVLLPGDTFGVQPDMTSELDHTAETVTEVSLCVFVQENVMRLFQSQPIYGWQLSWMLAHEQSAMNEHITNIGRRTAFERLGFFLLETFTRMERRDAAGNGVCEFPLRQIDVADALALSPETVNRLLAQMSRDGLARVSRGRLYIQDRKGLTEACHFHERFLSPKPLL